MSCLQPMKPNCQAFSYVTRKWSLSGTLSMKWADHSQNHPFSVTTKLPWEWPIKPSFHEKSSQWTCNSTGFVAETPKASLDTSGLQYHQILETTVPRTTLQYNSSLRKNPTNCALLPKADLNLLHISLDSRQGCLDPV